ncbi:MAG: AAA family ATPase, partial [Candidatus Saccharimonadales bacterium]
MAKTVTSFVCNNCGAHHSAWMGRCSQCGEWNTLVEEVPIIASGNNNISGKKLAVTDVAGAKASEAKRLSTDISEIDNVLGGGLVPGSVILLAGQPGIGKSTLLLQLAYAISAKTGVLYVSGEESASQIGLRANRLGASHHNLKIATSNSADDIAATVASGQFQLVIIDSIQTISVGSVSSAAGSVSQITNSSALLTAAAKAASTALVLVGHVTKEGMIAGPKVLEHLVDVVLHLEGDMASVLARLAA